MRAGCSPRPSGYPPPPAPVAAAGRRRHPRPLRASEALHGAARSRREARRRSRKARRSTRRSCRRWRDHRRTGAAQAPCASTADPVLPGVSSSVTKRRPATGRAPSIGSKIRLTRATLQLAPGSPRPVSVAYGANRDRDILKRRSVPSGCRNTARWRTSPRRCRSPGDRFHRITRRFGSAYGSGRSRTPAVRLKSAVFAPIPRARDITAARANPGLWRSGRAA